MHLAFSTLEYLLAAFALSFPLVLIWRTKVQSASLPPSPPAHPFIGHGKKIPQSEAWKTYAEWKKIYGDVIYARAPGNSMLILNSVAAARDLLEKKGTTFSDRPYLPVMYLMGWEFTLPMLRYGSRFRKHRRMMQQHIGHQTISSFRPIQEDQVHKFLHRLLANPEHFMTHVHRLVAGTIVLITYGHEVVSDDDALLELVERATHMTVSSGSVGTTLIDLFPFLRRVPAWVPGMNVKRLALETRKVVDEVMAAPFDEVKTNKAAGTAPPCIISSMLDEYEEAGKVDQVQEEDMMNFGTTIYNAGTDTTKSTLATFFLLMTLHPEIAKRAQEEIDSVVGLDSLPTLDERPSLPYIDCIMNEIFRFNPPLPLALPHRSTETERYRGWTIPEGTVTIPNIWQMMRDEKHFPDPEVFSPERHASKTTVRNSYSFNCEQLNEDSSITTENDPSAIVFGFGRRVCPGKFLVDAMLWTTIANVLAAFDIRPYKNPLIGVEELPKLEFENEFVRSPKAFKCTIVPRSAKHARMIRDEDR